MANQPLTSQMRNMPPRPEGAADPSIILWKDKDKKGENLSFTGEAVNYVGDKFNDTISSVQSNSGTWRLYHDKDFNNSFIEVKPGELITNLESRGMNDVVTSLEPIGW
jgi:Beta/Gamma crystallin